VVNADKLVFRQGGEQRVLHQIWSEHAGHVHGIIHGTEVKELAKSMFRRKQKNTQRENALDIGWPSFSYRTLEKDSSLSSFLIIESIRRCHKLAPSVRTLRGFELK
jgi:hypothetical protein